MSADLNAINAFLFREVRHLDDRQFEEWLQLYAPDAEYWMPAWDDDDQLTNDPHSQISLIYYPNRNGLEDRDDITIGVSLLAPHVRYPDHRHAPEEIYLVLTPGRFQHGESEWFEPGPGGTLHNIPNIRHAMASGDVSLLAIWCLLLR